MQKVGVVGAGGRMGQEVCRAVAAAPDLELVAAVDIEDDVSAIWEKGADVVVDFSVADAVRENLPRYAEHGIHAVVGTTGLTEAELSAAATAFEASTANAIVAANFTISAVLLMKLCEIAAPFMDGVEVIELHHNAKRDAPSGTAMHTAAGIAAARQRAGSGPWSADPTTETVL
ncbi:MAG TPA: dihydrodipicolinate reductase C-terminal domain-containing protein, partial [Acidimicrobiales bacterium]